MQKYEGQLELLYRRRYEESPGAPFLRDLLRRSLLGMARPVDK